MRLFLFFVTIFLVLLSVSSGDIAQGVSLRPSRRDVMLQRRLARRVIRLARRFPYDVPRSSSSPPSSFHSFSLSASVTSVSSVASFFDPLPPSDVRADILLLGTTTPILGGVRIFHNQEPLDVRALSIDFLAAPASVDSLLVYDSDRRFLGRAMLDTAVSGNRRFTLRIANGAFVVPQREERSVYVRALLKSRDAGGMSGEEIQALEFRVVGDGVWSNEEYTKTLTETFPVFQAARARLTAVTNAEERDGSLAFGQRQRIAAFRFQGERSDGAAELRVTSLTFQVSASSDITLSNAALRGRDAGEDHGCTIGSTTIVCSDIPAAHGGVPNGGRVIELFADVASTGTVTSPLLHITLNNPGTVDTSGHITWTDGTTTFMWVPFEQPVARGILLR